MNGHHQQNGVENMMLFEVVKMGKSAMQVRVYQTFEFLMFSAKKEGLKSASFYLFVNNF